MTRALADQRDTRVRRARPGHPCVAEADVRRVERIVRNLVTNAIDHAESRDIHIFVGGDEQSAAIAVRDHGVGLGPGESAMVFNRFWRADPARARTSGGTGLGLSISLEDTHLHGGWLQAWGRPGEGAQFRLTLPAQAQPAAAPQPAPAGARRRQGDGMRPAARAARRRSLALCGVLLATACVRMPSEGPVTEVDSAPRPASARARHLLRPPAAAGGGVGDRDRRQLPGGDEGEAEQHQRRARVPHRRGAAPLDAGEADHHLRRAGRPRRASRRCGCR